MQGEPKAIIRRVFIFGAGAGFILGLIIGGVAVGVLCVLLSIAVHFLK